MRLRPISALATFIVAASGLAQSTAFSYQGRVTNGGQLVNGVQDLRFSLFTAVSGGVQVGTTQCIDNVTVVDGVFTTTLDFGQQFATTAARFLQIELRSDTGLTCADATGFTILAPRQALTASPLANHAKAAFSLTAADGSPENAVFVNNSGNVGIGTTTPAALLHVNGIMRWGGATTTYAYSGEDASGLFMEQKGTNSTNSRMRLQSSRSGDLTNYAQFNIDPTSGFSFVTQGTGNSNVGIGTTTPLAKLDVRGLIRSNAGVRLDVSSGGLENLDLYNDSGLRIWSMGLNGFDPVNPGLKMISPVTGDFLAGFYRRPSDGSGVMFADEKNFRVPNPADLSTDIWYCCPEGPEASMYVRGTGQLVEGRAIIRLPEHFRSLACQQGMTVQLTPRSFASRGLAYSKATLDGIEVGELNNGAGTYEFDWRVEAVRKGHENYQVVRPWMRSDADEGKAWQNRLKWIEERRAHGHP